MLARRELPDGWGPEVGLPRVFGSAFADTHLLGVDFDVEEGLIATAEVA